MKNSQRGKASGAEDTTSWYSRTQPTPAIIPAAIRTPSRSASSRLRGLGRGCEGVLFAGGVIGVDMPTIITGAGNAGNVHHQTHQNATIMPPPRIHKRTLIQLVTKHRQH